MVDRIRALLLARQLSPTQFADAIGVARPIVSHIMSGRNKPSLEVVQKIVAAFPDLALDWLLKGTGPMIAAAAAPVAPPAVPLRAPSAPVAAPAPSRHRFVAPATPTPASKMAEVVMPAPALEPVSAAMPEPEAVVPASTAPAVAHVSEAKPANVVSEQGKDLPPEVALFSQPGKAIRRIVIFYRDGTFADYQPE